MLSHPLPIIALVVRYTTNKLVGRGVLLRPKSLVRRHYSVLPAVSRSYPDPQGKLPRVTLPCAAVHSINHSEEIKKELLARLACLIHAANVHSEPGSNPSIDIAYRTCCPKAEARVTSQLKNLRCTISVILANDFNSTTSTVSSNLTRKTPKLSKIKFSGNSLPF